MNWTTQGVGLNRILSAYLVVFLGILLAAFVWWGNTHSPAFPAQRGGDKALLSRVAYYRLERSRFNLVFLGDSRTYCDIHPEFLDPILGTRAINLSNFANWLPTQYAEISDLAPIIPADTTVVWTVGHQNFDSSVALRIQRVYPIRPGMALRYVLWRVPTDGLWDNVAYFDPWLNLWTSRADLRSRFMQWASRAKFQWTQRGIVQLPNVIAQPDSRPEENGALADSVAQFYSDPRVSSVTLDRDGRRVTSATVYFAGGGYLRIEIDPAFFRRKQAELAPLPMAAAEAEAFAVPSPAAPYLRIFDESLAQFRRYGIRLVVNEIEEAPFRYPHPSVREKYRRFMREVIRPRVEAAGFPYVTTDLNQLTDADYFDYNHLNSDGVRKYAPMLAAQLRPYVPVSR